jgi:hypothetical protein
MQDTTLVIVIAAVPTILVSLATFVQALRATNVSKTIAQQQMDQTNKIDQVHTLVNNAATEQRAEIAMLRSIIATKTMEASIAEGARQTLASEAATALAVSATVPPAPESGTPQIIKP